MLQKIVHDPNIDIDLNYYKNIDWNYLQYFIIKNGISELFYISLKKIPQQIIPSAILSSLQDQYRNTTMNNMLLVSELTKIIDSFQKKNINFVPFKGPVMNDRIYKNLSFKQSSDLDILIDFNNFHLVYQVLKQMDYIPQLPLSKNISLVDRIPDYYCNFTRRDSSILVDLHWAFEARNYSFSINYKDIENSLLTSSFQNRKIKIIPFELLIVILSIHGCKHYWQRLIWLIDFTLLVEQNTDINWIKILEFSNKFNCKKMLLISLFLSNYIFNTTLNNKVVEKIDENKDVTRIALIMFNNIFHKSNRTNKFLNKNLYVNSMEKNKDKITYYLNLINPSSIELNIINFPSYLYFLYYPLRFLRLAHKYLSIGFYKLSGLINIK